MKFIEIINNKKFTMVSIFLFFYVLLNFFDGERGLISYYEKQKIIKQMNEEKRSLLIQLNSLEKKNSLLSDVIDVDYVEILFREKFMVGKESEKIYIK